MSSYHGWTHRPKKQGGTDPIKRGAHLHIKVFPDEMLGVDLPVETGDGKFIFAVSEDMEGLVLTRAEAFITTISSGGDVEVQLVNITQSALMFDDNLIIAEGDNFSGPDAINAGAPALAWQNQIGIDVVQAGTGVWGLGVILEFS